MKDVKPEYPLGDERRSSLKALPLYDLPRCSRLLGVGVLRNEPTFLSRWLAQPATLPAVEHTDPTASGAQGGVTILGNKVGRPQLGGPFVMLAAEWTGSVNGHCRFAIFHEVSTSFARELREILRCSLFVGLRKPPMASLSKAQN